MEAPLTCDSVSIQMRCSADASCAFKLSYREWTDRMSVVGAVSWSLPFRLSPILERLQRNAVNTSRDSLWLPGRLAKFLTARQQFFRLSIFNKKICNLQTVLSYSPETSFMQAMLWTFRIRKGMYALYFFSFSLDTYLNSKLPLYSTIFNS